MMYEDYCDKCLKTKHNVKFYTLGCWAKAYLCSDCLRLWDILEKENKEYKEFENKFNRIVDIKSEWAALTVCFKGKNDQDSIKYLTKKFQKLQKEINDLSLEIRNFVEKWLNFNK